MKKTRLNDEQIVRILREADQVPVPEIAKAYGVSEASIYAWRKLSVIRQRPLPPTVKNCLWSYDFVYDAWANVQTIKCLTVVDEFTRECLAIDVARSMGQMKALKSGVIPPFITEVKNRGLVH